VKRWVGCLLAAGCVSTQVAQPPREEKAPPPPPPEIVEAEKPPEEPPTSIEEPAIVEKRYSPPAVGDRKFRVLLIGDSLARTDFGQALEERLDAHPRIECSRRGKSSSGLSRPDFFDWMSESERVLEKSDPDLVLVIIGGNDGQDLRELTGKARVIFRKPAWEPGYASRVRAFLDRLLGESRRVLWIGLPAMGAPRLEQKLEIIRRIQLDVVAARPERAIYLDSAPFFVDGRGKSIRSAEVSGWKQPQALRQDDGVHFSVPGSRYFADHVVPEVLRALGLEEKES